MFLPQTSELCQFSPSPGPYRQGHIDGSHHTSASRTPSLEYVIIVKYKVTNASRGFGYVKFSQSSHATKALEGCDPSYKPKFADPWPSLKDRQALCAGSTGGSEHSSEG